MLTILQLYQNVFRIRLQEFYRLLHIHPELFSTDLSYITRHMLISS